MKNSRRKGANGERELANKLKEYGLKHGEDSNTQGANGDADVVGIPGVHIECKRVEKLNLYDAMEQSQKDAHPREIPTVFHRKNHKPWLVTMNFKDFLRLYKWWEAGNGIK